MTGSPSSPDWTWTGNQKKTDEKSHSVVLTEM